MPRPKEFDPDKALDDAVEVFWKGGYEATSLRDLERGLGINRFSIYSSFTSKRDLFLKALDRYRDRVVPNSFFKDLEAPEASLPAIRAYFKQVVGQVPDTRGCLMLTCAVEVGRRDRVAARKVQAHVLRMERAFYRALRRAAERGQIRRPRNLRSAARRLTASAQGLIVLGQLFPERDYLQSMVDAVLADLR